jgi:hypothetical protein
MGRDATTLEHREALRSAARWVAEGDEWRV